MDGYAPSVLVPLAQPIPQGGSATVEVEWSVEIPDIPEGRRGARGGRRGARVVQAAQWYPQIAKYDDLRGWDWEPHLGGSEFYNNYGRFDVRLEVPAGWLVGATGVLQNADTVLGPSVRERLARVTESDSQQVIVGPEERGPGRATALGDRLAWHFVADTVNDFAWAASGDYLWDATRATIPGRGPIPVHLFVPARAPALPIRRERWLAMRWSSTRRCGCHTPGPPSPRSTVPKAAWNIRC